MPVGIPLMPSRWDWKATLVCLPELKVSAGRTPLPIVEHEVRQISPDLKEVAILKEKPPRNLLRIARPRSVPALAQALEGSDSEGDDASSNTAPPRSPNPGKPMGGKRG